MVANEASTTEGGKRVMPTAQSDIYSLAMVIIEVVSHSVCCPFKFLHHSIPVSRCSQSRYRFRTSPTKTSWSSYRAGGDLRSPHTPSDLGSGQRSGSSLRNVGIGTARNGPTSPKSSTVSKCSLLETPWLLQMPRTGPMGEGNFLQPKNSSGGRLAKSLGLSKSA